MVLQPLPCYLAFEVTLYYGPENNLWFSINSPGRAVSCYIRASWAAKVLSREISSTRTGSGALNSILHVLFLHIFEVFIFFAFSIISLFFH